MTTSMPDTALACDAVAHGACADDAYGLNCHDCQSPQTNKVNANVNAMPRS
jgi:hypothetical protein